jgi:hypothetical protein
VAGDWGADEERGGLTKEQKEKPVSLLYEETALPWHKPHACVQGVCRSTAEQYLQSGVMQLGQAAVETGTRSRDAVLTMREGKNNF